MKIETIRSLVRPFIAVAVVATLMYLFVSGAIESTQLLTLAGPVIGFYFGERAANKGAVTGQPDQEQIFRNVQ